MATTEEKVIGYCGHCGGQIKDKSAMSGKVQDAGQKLHTKCGQGLVKMQGWQVSVHNRKVQVL